MNRQRIKPTISFENLSFKKATQYPVFKKSSKSSEDSALPFTSSISNLDVLHSNMILVMYVIIINVLCKYRQCLW